MLSHANFISEGMQAMAWGPVGEADRVLAMLPIFHGFGLGALINAPLMCGARVIMVPVFTAEAIARLTRKARPTVMAGVPSMFDTLTSKR
jgi:long-chain acyl-CoA synthetase